MDSPRHRHGKFDSWEILSETQAIKYTDKSFFEHNGSGIPKDILWFFKVDELGRGKSRSISITYNKNTYGGRLTRESAETGRVRIFWDTSLGSALSKFRDEKAGAMYTVTGEDKYDLTIFIGEEHPVIKIQDSLSVKGNKPTIETEISPKEALDQIKSYISARGFDYPSGMIENFYLSLKSKPFVILAGTSGTGKTRLVRLFAEAIGAEQLTVPVRPDWSDSSDLFGHTDLSGKFIPGAVIDFICAAQQNPNRPYFLCLDEMNLARVEYYLSDILSVIETREWSNGTITTDPLIKTDAYGRDDAAKAKYGEIRFPQNLYLVGTVNMDETTFPFSKKVLDRANTIEFSFVDLRAKPWSDEQPEALSLPNSFLRSKYLLLKDVADDDGSVEALCDQLQGFNTILYKANLHVGYRVRDEICFYMSNNKADELLPEDEALDNEILQKILPRVQGSSATVRDMLCSLFDKLAGNHNEESGNSDADKMDKYLQNNAVKYPKSAAKIAMMVRRFEEDGFTSYWL